MLTSLSAVTRCCCEALSWNQTSLNMESTGALTLDFQLPKLWKANSIPRCVLLEDIEKTEGKTGPPHDRNKRPSESPALYYINNWLSAMEPTFLPPSLLSLLLSFLPVVELELRALCTPGTDTLQHLHSSLTLTSDGHDKQCLRGGLFSTQSDSATAYWTRKLRKMNQ